MRYDAFISYCRPVDAHVARALRDGLAQLARPWPGRRTLDVFLDDPARPVTAGLAVAQRAAFARTEWLVLLLSEEGAASPWVDEELAEWLVMKRLDRIALVVTSGELAWDTDAAGFDRGATAVPRQLRLRYRGGPEPPWLDLRWARDASAEDGSLDLRNPRFHEAVTALAAPMHGIPRTEMEVRDFRVYARASRRRRAAMSGLAVLAAAALAGSCAGYQAQQASEARVALAGAQEAAARAQADASWRSELAAMADARTANLMRTLAERDGPVAFQPPADLAEEIAAVSPRRAPPRTPKRKPGLAPLADHPGRPPLRQGPGDHLS